MRKQPDSLLSKRRSPWIGALAAIVVTEGDGEIEGIVRRVTPIGTQPFITDDVTLLPSMMELAREQFPDAPLQVATFVRVKDRDTLSRVRQALLRALLGMESREAHGDADREDYAVVAAAMAELEALP